jgi:geranylgeranyl pyrophosphate synthase
MLVKAFEMLSTSNPEHVSNLLKFIFQNRPLEVCEGQQLDMNFETQDKVSVTRITFT